EPWSPLERAQGERPAVLLAQGLSRAWLHLDHIVWRVFASPEPAHAPEAVPGGRLRVRTEDGVDFWVVELGEALRGVPQPLPPPRHRRPDPAPGAAAPMVPPLPPAPPPAGGRAPAIAVEPAPEPEPAPHSPPEPDLPVLTPDHVRALARPEPSAPAPPPPMAAAPVPPRAAARGPT